jgi:hypothetical protein
MMNQITRAVVMLGVLTGTVFAKDGYEPLFNGKDLSGWTVKCRPQDEGKQFWSVENGAIIIGG